MQTIDFTQGDDWSIDWQLEELDENGVWQPKPLIGLTIAQGLSDGAFQQQMVITPTAPLLGKFRASFPAASSQFAPVGVLHSNVQIIDGGLKSSTAAIAIVCQQDFTP